jgi:uncharacterized caspase-like protein
VERWKFLVPIPATGRLVEVHCSRKDGRWDSEPARTLLPGKPAPARKPRLFVVAAGVDKYGGYPGGDLNVAASSAQSVGRMFRERAGGLYAGKPSIRVLRDGEASKEGIRKALEEVARKADPNDVVVFFFSGHGYQRYSQAKGSELRDQRCYLFPSGFRSATGEPSPAELHAGGLSADELADHLSKIKAQKRVLILDTCHSGGAVLLGNRARDPFAFRGSIEGVIRTGGTFTIAAAAPGRETYGLDALEHSIFTYLLLGGVGAVKGDKIPGGKARRWFAEVTGAWRGRRRDAEVLNLFRFTAANLAPFRYLVVGGPRPEETPEQVQVGARGTNFPLISLGKP